MQPVQPPPPAQAPASISSRGFLQPPAQAYPQQQVYQQPQAYAQPQQQVYQQPQQVYAQPQQQVYQQQPQQMYAQPPQAYQQPAANVQSARLAPAAGAARSSRRAAAAESGAPASASVRRRKPRGGKEILIALGVIGALGVLALIMYMTKSSQLKEVGDIEKERKRIFEENMRRGEDAYVKAEAAGKLWAMGKDNNTDKLFAPFQGDSKVYNVIYDRNTKDKRGNSKAEQKAMDPAKLSIIKFDNKSKEGSTGAQIQYGFGDNRTKPIVVASKAIAPEAGDQVNGGGRITVIVDAEWDDWLRKNKDAKSASEKEKDGGAEEKK
jgi:hypothetical protein